MNFPNTYFGASGYNGKNNRFIIETGGNFFLSHVTGILFICLKIIEYDLATGKVTANYTAPSGFAGGIFKYYPDPQHKRLVLFNSFDLKRRLDSEYEIFLYYFGAIHLQFGVESSQLCN